MAVEVIEVLRRLSATARDIDAGAVGRSKYRDITVDTIA
jgi:hypothetical protein